MLLDEPRVDLTLDESIATSKVIEKLDICIEAHNLNDNN